VKINSDAAFYADKGSGATSYVIRDHLGRFVTAQAQWHVNLLDAEMGEALACRDAVVLARQLGLQRVQLETDCLELVQLWNKKELQRSILDPILSEIEEVRLAFIEFVFKYVRVICVCMRLRSFQYK
jgi:hypothetical protein